MSGGYALIAGVLLYIFLLRTVDSARMNPLRAATILLVGYYLLTLFVTGMQYVLHDVPLWPNLFSPIRVATAVVQFVAAMVVFRQVEEGGDSYMTYMVWGGFGLAFIFFITPPIVQQLFMTLGM